MQYVCFVFMFVCNAYICLVYWLHFIFEGLSFLAFCVLFGVSTSDFATEKRRRGEYLLQLIASNCVVCLFVVQRVIE